jgi:hypothetical protein
MCTWAQSIRTEFEGVVTKLTQAGLAFDTLAARNALRAAVVQQGAFEASAELAITYNDVFSELWHYYRKGKFAQPYLIRTKTVVIDTANGDTTVTVEYVPTVQVTLKKVREQWESVDAKARLDAMDTKRPKKGSGA